MKSNIPKFLSRPFLNNIIIFRTSSRKVAIYSLIALILFHLITFSWPFIPGHVTMYSSNNSSNGVGCDVSKFSWCQSLAPINVYLYYIAYGLLIGFAFPTINITNTTLFSKVLGPRRQGTQQGIFQASGGIARTVGPIVVSVLYTKYGPRMAWIMEIVVISLTLLSWLVFYRRMVPLKIPTAPESINSHPSVDTTIEAVPESSFPSPYEECKRSRSMSI